MRRAYLGWIVVSGLLCLLSGGCGNDEGTMGDAGSGGNGDSENGGNDGYIDPNATSDVCQYLIDCARATNTAGVTALVATYGDEGECWAIAGVEPKDCWTECRAALEAMRELNPEVPECSECKVNEDCMPFEMPYCDTEKNAPMASCAESICGNGQLEGPEICDPSFDPSCSEDCTESCNECHPFHAEGVCGAGQQCTVLVAEDGSGNVTSAYGRCTNYGTGGQLAACMTNGDCGLGFVCKEGLYVEGCDTSGYCCTEVCDVGNPQCPDGTRCNAEAVSSQVNVTSCIFVGLDVVGYCGR